MKKYKYEDFNDYTLEESLQILQNITKKQGIYVDDLIEDISKELKNQDESVAKCNELIKEIVDVLNDNNKMTCPMCEEGELEHREYFGTHIYSCSGLTCPFMGFEYVERKDITNMIEYLGGKLQ